jgi:hypothetical protein
MMTIFNNMLPTLGFPELRQSIFSYIGGERSYWQRYFSKTVLVQLDPKGYFSRNVLPEIDQGWRLTGLFTAPCADCRDEGYRIPNPECEICFFLTPCCNCYWYDLDPYGNGNVCNCGEETVFVSWGEITEQMPDLKAKYPRYWDFVRGAEWNAYLEDQAQQAAEIERRYQEAILRQEELIAEGRRRRIEQARELQEQLNTRLNHLARFTGMFPNIPVNNQTDRRLVTSALEQLRNEYLDILDELAILMERTL